MSLIQESKENNYSLMMLRKGVIVLKRWFHYVMVPERWMLLVIPALFILLLLLELWLLMFGFYGVV